MVHISIEGIDGVGKSTTAKNLAKYLNYELVEKPLHYLFDEEGDDNYIRIRNEINKNKNKKYTGWFYGLGNIFLYEKFKDQNIVTDRHILSNYCWSGSDDTDYIFDAIYKTIGAPTFTFLIYAEPEAVKARLISRDKNDPDLKKIKFIPEAYDRMKKILNKYEMPSLVIDTTNMNAEEVLNTMINELKKRGIING